MYVSELQVVRIGVCVYEHSLQEEESAVELLLPPIAPLLISGRQRVREKQRERDGRGTFLRNAKNCTDSSVKKTNVDMQTNYQSGGEKGRKKTKRGQVSTRCCSLGNL